MSQEDKNMEPYDPADTPSGAPRDVLQALMQKFKDENEARQADTDRVLIRGGRKRVRLEAAAKAAKAAPKP